MTNVVPFDPPNDQDAFYEAVTGTDPLADVETEQALLGGLITDTAKFWEVDDVLLAQHFASPTHGAIFDQIQRLMRAEGKCSPNTLHFALRDNEHYRAAGGRDYLGNLASASVTTLSSQLRDYAMALFDLAMRRTLVRDARDLIEAATHVDPLMPSSTIIAEAEGWLGRLAEQASVVVKDVKTAHEAATSAMHQFEEAARNPHVAVISTGLKDVDDKLGGLIPSDLLVIGGNTSMGKTALAQWMAWHAGRHDHGTLIFSKEMTSPQWMARHISQIARVPVDMLESGKAGALEMEYAAKALDHFNGLPIRIDDSPGLTVAQMRSKTVRTSARMKTKLSLVVVDHLRFIRAEDSRADFASQMMQITRDLKAMAKALNVCVLLLAHLNRALWSRDDHRPQMSDLYGASAIEQNADTIAFIHREEYYLRRKPPADGALPAEQEKWSQRLAAAIGKAEVLVEKRRRGPAGRKATIKFDERFAEFGDL